MFSSTILHAPPMTQGRRRRLQFPFGLGLHCASLLYIAVSFWVGVALSFAYFLMLTCLRCSYDGIRPLQASSPPYVNRDHPGPGNTQGNCKGTTAVSDCPYNLYRTSGDINPNFGTVQLSHRYFNRTPTLDGRCSSTVPSPHH